MIKRLFFVGLLAGLGHLIVFLSLSFIAQKLNIESIAEIGKVDSLVLLLSSIISFGLQLFASREIVISENWKAVYSTVMTARITIAILIFIVGIILSFVDKFYLLLIISPLIALNGDFALYSRGLPIKGALMAFLRVSIPAFCLVVTSFILPKYVYEVYVMAFFISYILIGVLIAIILKVPYLIKPKLGSLKLYLNSIKLGISSFALIFIGLGIVNIASMFYNDETIAIIYVALKLYMIFKGVRRLIVQAFYKELTQDKISVKIDKLAIVAGLLFFIITGVFSKIFILICYNESYISQYLVFGILGLSGLISSLTASTGSRLLLQRKDSIYNKSILLASACSILTVIIGSYFYYTPLMIATSVFLGEVVLVILLIIGIKEKNYIMNRVNIFN